MRTVILKLMFTRSCYDAHAAVMINLSVMVTLILPVISLPYQLHHDVKRQVAAFDKMAGFPHCRVVVPRVASFANIGPDRSVLLPEVVNLGHVCTFTRRRTETKTIKREFQYIR